MFLSMTVVLFDELNEPKAIQNNTTDENFNSRCARIKNINIIMNRDEQETLYRTSRTLSLVPGTAPTKLRHYSHGNIHQIHGIVPSNVNKSASVNIYPDTEDEGDDEDNNQTGRINPEDLVLSVLKSPLNHIGNNIFLSFYHCVKN